MRGTRFGSVPKYLRKYELSWVQNRNAPRVTNTEILQQELGLLPCQTFFVEGVEINRESPCEEAPNCNKNMGGHNKEEKSGRIDFDIVPFAG